MAGTGSYISLYVSWDLAEHIHNIGGKRYYSIYICIKKIVLGLRIIALFLLFFNYIILGKQDKISTPPFPHFEILSSIPLPLLSICPT